MTEETMGKNDTTKTTTPPTDFTVEIGTTLKAETTEAAAALEQVKAEVSATPVAPDAKPPRSVYKHKTCGSLTRMRPGMVKAVAEGKKLETPFCEGCRTTAPASEFVWCEVEGGAVSVTKEPVGDAKPVEATPTPSSS